LATPKPLINHTKQDNLEILKQAIIEAKNNTITLPTPLDKIIDEESLPYCFKDSNNEEYYLLPSHIIKTLLESAKKLQRDKYLFQLEQEIHKNMPIDFEDVWCIAIKEIGKNFQKDPKRLIKNIRKRYPYLFIDFQNFNPLQNPL